MSRDAAVDPWAVLDALPEALLVLDADARVRYRNLAATPLEAFDAATRERLTAAIRDVLSRRAGSLSIDDVSHPSEARSLSLVVRHCTVGGRDGVIIEQRDVTATKRAEAALRESEDRFHTLVDGSPDIVFITDASSRMRYANAALEQQTGYTVADFQMRQEDNRLIHPDDQERVATFLREFVESGRKYSGPLKNRFVARDGKTLWYSSVVSRSEYEGEPVLQFVVHNITEQEATLEKLARAQEQLFERERLAALGELAAVVAHEIRNPLSIIYNALTSLRKQPTLNDADTLFRILEDEATRLQRTVRALLDFTKPMEPSFERSDLLALAREALSSVASEQPNASAITVTWRAQEPPYDVEVDSQMIHQVIVNLIANAFQAMPNGGHLAIELEKTSLRDKSAVQLAITDSGSGIPSDAKARIFEPFFTTRAMGTGLGLALAKRIVEAHGGSITATSIPGGGARFVLCVLVSRAVTAPSTA